MSEVRAVQKCAELADLEKKLRNEYLLATHIGLDAVENEPFEVS